MAFCSQGICVVVYSIHQIFPVYILQGCHWDFSLWESIPSAVHLYYHLFHVAMDDEATENRTVFTGSKAFSLAFPLTKYRLLRSAKVTMHPAKVIQLRYLLSSIPVGIVYRSFRVFIDFVADLYLASSFNIVFRMPVFATMTEFANSTSVSMCKMFFTEHSELHSSINRTVTDALSCFFQ